MNKVAWLCRGTYGFDEEDLKENPTAFPWEIEWYEPHSYEWCEIKKVVIIELDDN